MKRLSMQALLFSILFLFFFILLFFVRTPFTTYPLMSNQDALDLLTPLVLIPVYWLIFKRASSIEPTFGQEITFLVLAALWVEGQGIHLAANSINNLAGHLADRQVIDISATDLYTLTYFLDEHLSHYLWHFGIVGLAVVLIYQEWRSPAGQSTIWWATILGGVLYGFTAFMFFTEGQTTPLGLPFTILVVAFTLISGRKKLNTHPVLAFFFVSFLVALLFFAGWIIYTGFTFPIPEPTERLTFL